MASANPKQINVFVVNGSLNTDQLNKLKTIVNNTPPHKLSARASQRG
jgi:Ni,Fe-hydrogenase III small subunit